MTALDGFFAPAIAQTEAFPDGSGERVWSMLITKHHSTARCAALPLTDSERRQIRQLRTISSRPRHVLRKSSLRHPESVPVQF